MKFFAIADIDFLISDWIAKGLRENPAYGIELHAIGKMRGFSTVLPSKRQLAKGRKLKFILIA